jgi:uroporphyrinogen decarboxylase
VFNLGHGVLPLTPPESVSALIEEVRAYSRKLLTQIHDND